MDWQEQINKLEEKLYKVREKKKKILEDEKELLEKLKNARQKKEEDDNRKLAAIVEEQLGEMSEEKMLVLKNLLAEHAGDFSLEEEKSNKIKTGDMSDFVEAKTELEENFSEESQTELEKNSGDSGKNEDEGGGYHW